MQVKPYHSPMKWRVESLEYRLRSLIEHYCTGPCGQSRQTLDERSNTRSTLREAIDEIKRLREQNNKLAAQILSAQAEEGS